MYTDVFFSCMGILLIMIICRCQFQFDRSRFNFRERGNAVSSVSMLFLDPLSNN